MTAKVAIKRPTYISYQKTLICLDGVQLFTALSGRKRRFICLAVPDDEADELFLCAPVSESHFADYMYEQLDLYGLLKSSTTRKFYTFELNKPVGARYELKEIKSVPDGWMPERHIFSGSHTEAYDFEEDEATADAPIPVEDSVIAIDGRWDARDLATLPELFTDNYSFVYALLAADRSGRSRANEMFRKFPWKGGFSTVGFYDGLYRRVPREHRLAVRGISYNSPGTITLSAVNVAIQKIKDSVSALNDVNSSLQTQYRELRDGMSARELLGRSTHETVVDENDINFVSTRAKLLALDMKFDQLDQLHKLTESNWIATAKILLSYYRRLKMLADFLDTGKAAFRS